MLYSLSRTHEVHLIPNSELRTPNSELLKLENSVPHKYEKCYSIISSKKSFKMQGGQWTLKIYKHYPETTLKQFS